MPYSFYILFDVSKEEMTKSMPLKNNFFPLSRRIFRREWSNPKAYCDSHLIVSAGYLNIVSWGAFRTIKEFLKIAIHIPQIEKREEPLLEYGGKEARGRVVEFCIHAN